MWRSLLLQLWPSSGTESHVLESPLFRIIPPRTQDFLSLRKACDYYQCSSSTFVAVAYKTTHITQTIRVSWAFRLSSKTDEIVRLAAPASPAPITFHLRIERVAVFFHASAPPRFLFLHSPSDADSGSNSHSNLSLTAPHYAASPAVSLDERTFTPSIACLCLRLSSTSSLVNRAWIAFMKRLWSTSSPTPTRLANSICEELFVFRLLLHPQNLLPDLRGQTQLPTTVLVARLEPGAPVDNVFCCSHGLRKRRCTVVFRFVLRLTETQKVTSVWPRHTTNSLL